MDHILGRDFVGSGAEDLGRRQRGDLGTRDGSSAARGGRAAGWVGQGRGQNAGSSGSSVSSGGNAAGSMRSEAEAFMNSS
jgi:hypothetical protein